MDETEFLINKSECKELTEAFPEPHCPELKVKPVKNPKVVKFAENLELVREFDVAVSSEEEDESKFGAGMDEIPLAAAEEEGDRSVFNEIAHGSLVNYYQDLGKEKPASGGGNRLFSALRNAPKKFSRFS